MKKMLLKHAFYIIAMLFSTAMLAQVTVTGVVSDQMGPLPGVNVLEKGTQNGTVTGFDGDFTLEVAEDAILVFSYVGFKTQEVAVDGQTTIDVKLEEDAAKLDEVIVVGYGSTTKKDRTGAVETVSSEDFNKGVQTNATDLLQGRTPGIQVTTAGGEPGSSTTIRIRGNASFRPGGNDPLYVVDGMLINSNNPSAGTGDVGFGTSSNKNPLNFINPGDIENISVLKDASATAIYGSRGANGVIIVTTKKGKFGEPKINYSSTFAAAEVSNEFDMLSAGGFRNALQVEGFTGFDDPGANVDAFDAITRTAQTMNHNLTILGGGEKSQYRYSLSALDQEGVVESTRIRNYSASLSNSYRFLEDDRLKVDVNLIASYVRDNRAPITNNADFEGNLIGAALFWNPTVPLLNNDGSFRQQNFDFDDQGSALSPNPLAILNFNDITEETSRIVGNISATYELTDGLNYKLNFGVDRSESNNRTSASRQLDKDGIRNSGTAVNSNRILFSSLIEHTLNYKKEFGEDYKLDALVGYGYQRFEDRGFSAIGRNNDIEVDNGNNFLSGFNDVQISSFKAPLEELESYFGRAVFSAYGKYTFTATFRADGSSKFGDNNEWGYFPAFAGAWNFHEEDFAPDFFNQLKLRASWGQSGNQNFSPGSSQGRFALGNDDGNTTLIDITATNPNLQWEVNETINVGIDFAFLDNKLSGSIDLFQRDVDDLIIIAPPTQPAPPGITVVRNLENSTIRNQGIELGLFADIVNTEDWSFTLGGNATFIDNEVQDFAGGVDIGPINGQGLTGNFAQRIESGQPVNSFFIVEFAGFDENGIPQYFDENNNLVTDANAAERRFVGDPNPDLTIGLNANLRYKNWDMTVNMNGAYGHQIYNNTANVLSKNNLTARNVLADLIGNGEDPGAINAVSTRYLESADFLRLNNLTVGYNFKTDDLPKYIKNLRIFATGQNLFVITPYSGFDPEVNTENVLNGIPSFGIAYLPFPRARTYSLGLNVSF